METPHKASYHHGDLRRALLDAAVELLESDGAGALSLRAVARRAGVSATAPYHHFADKAALLAAVNTQSFEGLKDTMSRTAGDAADTLDRIVLLGMGYVTYATRHPARFQLMFGPKHDGSVPDGSMPDEDLAREGAAAYRMIEDAIGNHLARVSPPAPEAATATLAAWSMVHGLATLLVDGRIDVPLTDRDAILYLARDACRLFVAGLGDAPRPT